MQELGITKKDLILISEKIRAGNDPALAIAASSIDIDKLQELLSKFRTKLSCFIANILHDFFKSNSNKKSIEIAKRLENGDLEEFGKIFKNLILYIHEQVKYDETIYSKDVHQFFVWLNDEGSNVIIDEMNDNIRNYISQGLACIAMEFSNSAIANIEMALILSFNKIKAQKITNSILIKQGEIKRGKEASKRSNQKRHAKTKLIKQFAINLYLQGNYPSVRNAAQRIAQEVMNYAHYDEKLKAMEGTDKKFTDHFAAADTIERWLGEYRKKHNKRIT